MHNLQEIHRLRMEILAATYGSRYSTMSLASAIMKRRSTTTTLSNLTLRQIPLQWSKDFDQRTTLNLLPARSAFNHGRTALPEITCTCTMGTCLLKWTGHQNAKDAILNLCRRKLYPTTAGITRSMRRLNLANTQAANHWFRRR